MLPSRAKALRKLFNRLPLENIVNLVTKEWGMEISEMDQKKGKRYLIDTLLSDNLNSGISQSQIADLDLYYYQTHPNVGKRWSVLHLQTSEQNKEHPPITSAEKFEQLLSNQLSIYYNQCTRVRAHTDSSFWIRIGIDDGLSASPTSIISSSISASSSSSIDSLTLPIGNILYFIYFPRTDVIFSTTVRVGHKKYVYHSLATVLHFEKIQETELSGRSIDGLRQMILHKDAQGPFRTFVESSSGALLSGTQKMDTDDISSTSTTTSSTTNENGGVKMEEDGESGNSVHAEDVQAQQRISQSIQNTFGNSAQPTLDRAEFKIQDIFRGRESDEEPLTGLFPMTVRMEGTNVIEGLRELVRHGIARPPLPDYLANLHSAAKNRFIVTTPDGQAWMDENPNAEVTTPRKQTPTLSQATPQSSPEVENGTSTTSSATSSPANVTPTKTTTSAKSKRNGKSTTKKRKRDGASA